MGLFGGGNSKTSTSTSNTDNSVINDYANANWDNSITGEYAGNTGTINTVDAGSFDLAERVVDSNVDVVGHAINAVKSGAGEAMSLVDGLFNNGLSAVRSVAGDAMLNANDANRLMAGLATDSMTLAEGVNARTLDSALMVHDSALSQIEMGNNLALGLAANAREQSAETRDSLGDGFEQMMQFAEGFSRSDGNDVAKTNMQTVGVIAAALVLAAFALRSGSKK